MSTARIILPERFWSKVDKSHPEGCWLWMAARTSFGHGRFKINGKLHSPHRLSFLAHHGDIAPGMDVCHRCDRPACVNPAHLFAGTRQDNMLDCARKGRLNSKGKPAALTSGDLDRVKALVSDVGACQAARILGVNRKTIYRFLRRVQRGGAQ